MPSKEYYQKNKERILANDRQYRINNKERMKKWWHEHYLKKKTRGIIAAYQEKNREHLKEYAKLNRVKNNLKNKEYHKKRPWCRTYQSIIQRCTNPKQQDYKYYGGKGIQNFLTLLDVQVLWNRDGATLMKKASIDRLDSDKHYTFENCRFIEQSENSARINKRNPKQF